MRSAEKVKPIGGWRTLMPEKAAPPIAFQIKCRRYVKSVRDLDDINVTAIRKTMQVFHRAEWRVPIASSLRVKLVKSTNFHVGNTSVKIILRQVQFKWNETRRCRAVPQERSDA